MQKRKINTYQNALAIILTITLLGPSLYLYNHYKQGEEMKAFQVELQHEIANLEGSLLALDEQNQHTIRVAQRAQMDAKIKKKQLANMSKKVDELEGKIARMAKEQKAGNAMIQQLKDKLNKAKSTLVNRYKTEMDLLFQDNVRLVFIGDSLNKQLNLKDSLCRFEEKNLGLKPWLKTENIRCLGIKGDKQEGGSAFKKGRIETLKVEFDLVGMGPVPNNTKDIYLILESPQKTTMLGSSAGNEWFTYKGQIIPYSSKAKVNYQGTPQKVNMFFDPKDGIFPKGSYQVKLFSGQEFIGQKQVEII